MRALTGLGEWERAKKAAEEICSIASLAGTIPLRAAANFALGHIALRECRFETARQHLEDAVDFFRQSGAPFEVARGCMELARALDGLRRTDAACAEAQHAIDLLAALKAEGELSRARSLLESLAARRGGVEESTPAGERNNGLSRRELEVLRFVAEGLNNQAIAERLFLSTHTVHRHLANILHKLDVSSRAAAVAQAARQGLLSR